MLYTFIIERHGRLLFIGLDTSYIVWFLKYQVTVFAVKALYFAWQWKLSWPNNPWHTQMYAWTRFSVPKRVHFQFPVHTSGQPTLCMEIWCHRDLRVPQFLLVLLQCNFTSGRREGVTAVGGLQFPDCSHSPFHSLPLVPYRSQNLSIFNSMMANWCTKICFHKRIILSKRDSLYCIFKIYRETCVLRPPFGSINYGNKWQVFLKHRFYCTFLL